MRRVWGFLGRYVGGYGRLVVVGFAGDVEGCVGLVAGNMQHTCTPASPLCPAPPPPPMHSPHCWQWQQQPATGPWGARGLLQAEPLCSAWCCTSSGGYMRCTELAWFTGACLQAGTGQLLLPHGGFQHCHQVRLAPASMWWPHGSRSWCGSMVCCSCLKCWELQVAAWSQLSPA